MTDFVKKSGDHMQGPLYLRGTPSTDDEAATKKYVDDHAGGGGGSSSWGGITGTLSDQSDLQTALDAKVATSRTVNGHPLSGNVSVTKSDVGLGNVPNTDTTTTANIADSTNKRFVTDAELTVLGNTSGANTGDQTSVSGNAGTATKLATARNINGVSFDGTADITVADSTKVPTTTTVNGHALSGNISVTASDLSLGNVDNTSDATKNAAAVTLTNKRVTKRVLALSANSATPSINTDSYDVVHITSQTTAITSFTTNLSGTPVDGDTLRISITGTASVALTFGTSFEASVTPLPTSTSSTTRLDIGFVWNSETSKWRCVAVS